jgi:hypothetical protein
MALMYGGSASTVNLRPSLRKVNSALEPIRIRKQQQQQTMISNARFTTPPTSLRFLIFFLNRLNYSCFFLMILPCWAAWTNWIHVDLLELNWLVGNVELRRNGGFIDRSTSSSFVNSGLLRSEVDKFIHSIARSSYGGALSTECSVSLSTKALHWLFGVATVWVWFHSFLVGASFTSFPVCATFRR